MQADELAAVLLSVGSQAASVDVSTATLLLSLAVFTVLAALPFISAVAFLVCGREPAGPILERFKQWLIDHHRVTVPGVLGVLGLVLLAQGRRLARRVSSPAPASAPASMKSPPPNADSHTSLSERWSARGSRQRDPPR